MTPLTHKEPYLSSSAQQNGGTEPLAPCAEEEGDGCYIQVPNPAGGAMELSVVTATATTGEQGTKQDRARINSSEAKLLAKKRVIRMLVVIVVVFFVCWLPIYGANTWRAFDAEAAQRALAGTPISFIHLFSYTSACINPFIYCFMNKRFRKAFAATFSCCPRGACRTGPPRHRTHDEELTATGPSLSKFSYTTVSSVGPP
ncbi:hypothetical protein JD844_033833 [Phrynosoma platyrhinos]|uniref:G-protein coupled receptors family 1 profile domain-containing protein n=1 Tax=Phrynosoma platyrhinos TaxID=52577 RepID=A0ABQ7T6F6_PHRPL|nr:hypothetical protein JD844_033833 [Phrynosoma platyrhinos]